jgi:hypothetical protein
VQPEPAVALRRLQPAAEQGRALAHAHDAVRAARRRRTRPGRVRDGDLHGAGPVLDGDVRPAGAVPRGVRQRLLEDAVRRPRDARRERARRRVHRAADGQPGGAVPVQQRRQRPGVGGHRRRGAVVVPQGTHQPVDLADRLARHLLHDGDRLPGALRVAAVEQPRGARLDEDHVDRVPGGVVELAGDAGPLLGGGEPPFPFRLADGVLRLLLQVGGLVGAHPGPVAGEPDPQERHRPHQVFRHEPGDVDVARGVGRPRRRHEQGDGRERHGTQGPRRAAVPVPDLVRGGRGAERCVQRVAGGEEDETRHGDQHVHGQRRGPAQHERQGARRGQPHAERVERAGAGERLPESAVPQRQQGARERQHGDGDVREPPPNRHDLEPRCSAGHVNHPPVGRTVPLAEDEWIIPRRDPAGRCAFLASVRRRNQAPGDGTRHVRDRREARPERHELAGRRGAARKGTSVFERLAGWSRRWRWWAPIGWLVVLLGVTAAARAVGGDYHNDFSLPGTESQAALDTLRERSPVQAGSQVQVVVADPEGLAASGTRQRVEDLLGRVTDLPHVADVRSPYAGGSGAVSPDGTVGYATVTLDGQAEEVPGDAVRAIVDTARAAAGDGLQVELGGDAVRAVEEGEGGAAEGVGLLVGLVILVLMFGSLLAASLPIVVAVFAVGSAIGLLTLASHVATVADFTTPLMVLVGLGVGIDYALLLFSRYRSELLAGATADAAARRALDTVGRTVFLAGLTVVIALLGLVVLGLGSLQGVAVAVALTVLATVFASLTLLPALLAVMSTRVERSVRRRAARRGRPDGDRWRRWSALVQRRPWPFAVVAVAALLALSAPALDLRLGFADAGNDDPATTSRRAYDLLAEGSGPASTARSWWSPRAARRPRDCRPRWPGRRGWPRRRRPFRHPTAGSPPSSCSRTPSRRTRPRTTW